MLKKEILYRAYMALKNEDSLCLSPRVHDVLKDANISNIGSVLQKLIDQGELITLKQLAHYMNELGLQLDVASDFAECVVHREIDEYIDIDTGELIMMYDYGLNENIAGYTPYAITQVSGWCAGHVVRVHVIPLRDCLLEAQVVGYGEDPAVNALKREYWDVWYCSLKQKRRH